MELRGQITDPKAAMKYLLAGKATLTLVSTASHNRYTYKVTLADKRNPNDQNEAPTWFVSLLNGPDNWTNYAYIGMIKNGEFRWTGKSRVSKEAPSFVGFNFVFNSLKADCMRGFEFWHEDRCGRCGHPLTVPESIATGFGPDCAAKLGVATVPQPQPQAVAAGAAAKSDLKDAGYHLLNFADQPRANGAPAPQTRNVASIDAEIRRRVAEYKANDVESYTQDGELDEKQAFSVAYNMFRVQIEREGR